MTQHKRILWGTPVDGSNALFANKDGHTVDAHVLEVSAAFLFLMERISDEDLVKLVGKESGFRYLEAELRKTPVADYNVATGEVA